jgi:cyclic-di-AMP phosphodiesterase PgpH
VMLVDAVEGATRAMQEPTPSRIEGVVHQMLMKRLQDGQFDECDITMRDLRLIEASLVKSLCGMYHTRIAYPKTEKPERLERESVG